MTDPRLSTGTKVPDNLDAWRSYVADDYYLSKNEVLGLISEVERLRTAAQGQSGRGTFAAVVVGRMSGLIDTANPHHAWEIEAAAEMAKAVRLLSQGPDPAYSAGNCGIAVEREDLADMLDSWADAANYKGEYLREKHGDVGEIAKYRAKYLAVSSTEGK